MREWYHKAIHPCFNLLNDLLYQLHENSRRPAAAALDVNGSDPATAATHMAGIKEHGITKYQVIAGVQLSIPGGKLKLGEY